MNFFIYILLKFKFISNQEKSIIKLTGLNAKRLNSEYKNSLNFNVLEIIQKPIECKQINLQFIIVDIPLKVLFGKRYEKVKNIPI